MALRPHTTTSSQGQFPWIWLGATWLLSCQGTEGQLLTYDDPSQAGATSLGGSHSELESPNGTGGWQAPPLDVDFQLQLSGALEPDQDLALMVLDLHSPSTEELTALRRNGSYLACYFSAGSHEPWRDDSDSFPEEALGDPLENYPNERWIDISRNEVLEVMRLRIAYAAERGCDAIYASIVRPAIEDLSFGLTTENYSDYASWLAAEAHSNGLAAIYAGNATFEQEALAYDGALVFGCASSGTCLSWTDYRLEGDGVYLIELENDLGATSACELDRPAGWPLVVKNPQLGPARVSCQ